jgi:hypothetical protein
VILANGKQPYWREVRRVTHDTGRLTRINRNYIENRGAETLDAVAFEQPNGDFDIWVSPELDPETPYFHQTLLHELCHGYLGVLKGHNHLWKELYTRVLYHYNDLVEDLGDVTSFVNHILTWGKYNPRLKNESLDDFSLRRLQVQSRYLDQVLAERDKVADIYNRMSDKEFALASRMA